MGRFARSNDRSKAQAKLEAPRGAFRSWKLSRQQRDARSQKQNKADRKVFKLFSLVSLLIIGASFGWMTGRIFIGNSQSNIIQPAAMVERLPGSEVAADKSQPDADKNAAPAVETTEQNEVASAHRASGTDNEKTDSDYSTTEREPHPSVHSAPTQSGARAARRYVKGRGFQPTTILTKPAKVLSKPFKKINPAKIF